MGWFEEASGLRGTVAVVTGGAGGLGEQISIDLAANEVRVAVVDIDEEAVRRLERNFAELGYDAVIQHGDARDPQVLSAALRRGRSALGSGVDTLVNVVGGNVPGRLHGDQPRRVGRVAAHELAPRAACVPLWPSPVCVTVGGAAASSTSPRSKPTAPRRASRCTRPPRPRWSNSRCSLAVELGPDGIRVNNVAPDFTPTPNMLKIREEVPTSATPFGARIRFPLARAGEPRDVSGCVVFLASDLAAYVTGTTLHPDGGTLASSGWFNWPESGWDMVPRRVVEWLAAEAESTPP